MNRGFTLIELMIVVAIIAILAAVAIPAMSGKSPESSSSVGFGTVVQSVDQNSPRCVNGVLLQNNQPVVQNGAAVKC